MFSKSCTISLSINTISVSERSTNGEDGEMLQESTIRAVILLGKRVK
jgi:hypothetical protein